MNSLQCSCDDAFESVLDTLKLVKDGTGQTREHVITVASCMQEFWWSVNKEVRI